MTGLVVTLILGAVAAAAALAFVLIPMFMGPGAVGARRPRGVAAMEATDDSARAVDALREIEFDRETGKLSDADYAALKATYTAAALTELRGGEERTVGRVAPTAGAARPSTSRCPTCGPRPEADALFCSNCARYLPGNCETCGAPVAEPAARYCAGCGHRLVA
jgi:hypothetical protein